MAAQTYISTDSVGASFFSTLSSAFVICKLFSDGHSDQYDVVPHYSYDLHFSNNYVEHFSMYLLANYNFD